MRDGDEKYEPRTLAPHPDKKFLVQNPHSGSEDWHPADIKAALEKRGLTLSGLSREAGYSETSAGRALRTTWPAMEVVIADALEVTPSQIWPSRYDENGIPLKYLPRSRRKGVRSV